MLLSRGESCENTFDLHHCEGRIFTSFFGNTLLDSPHSTESLLGICNIF